VFGYYEAMVTLVPRRLIDRDALAGVELYRGRIEIVRDGVLEAVSFPTPLAVRSAVGDVSCCSLFAQHPIPFVALGPGGLHAACARQRRNAHRSARLFRR
jgi:hypothetical protein